MANYQVPTEGLCSLTPMNTMYVNAQYTLALSWISAQPVNLYGCSSHGQCHDNKGPFYPHKSYQIHVKPHV